MKLSFIVVVISSLVAIAQVIPAQSALSAAKIAIIATDEGNYGTGADITVRFESIGDVQLSKLYVVPSGTEFDAEMAKDVEDAYTTSLTDVDLSKPLYLTDSTTDIAGNSIVENQDYQIFAMTESGELSVPSPAITLVNETVVITIVPELDAAAGGLEVDAEGNIYFADFGEQGYVVGSRVYKITPSGDVSIFLDDADLLQQGTGNAFDSQGNFYQSSLTSSAVLKVTPDGEVTSFATEGISNPVGIIIDSEDNLYVTNCRSATVQKITPDGESTRFVLSRYFACANGITLDDDNNLYVANFRNNVIVKVTPEGEDELFAMLPGGNNSHITYHDGLLYAVSRGENQVFTITLDGEITLLAGTGEKGNADGPALEATFTRPNDLVFSPDGSRIYLNEVVADTDGVNYPSVVRAIVLAREE